jgi:hypothetical protein
MYNQWYVISCATLYVGMLRDVCSISILQYCDYRRVELRQQ